MRSRRQFLAAAGYISAAGVLSACSGGSDAGDNHSPVIFNGERGVGIGFEDVVSDDPAWSELGKRLVAVKATALSIAVGRTDWTAFPWENRLTNQASLVRETGRDYVREAVDELTSGFPADQRPRITLTIDALIPGWISRDAEVAGINPDGDESESFASLSALATGPVGDELVRLAEEVCERYRPEKLCLTELMFDNYTFGLDDLDHFREHTDLEDWPRTADHQIDTEHEVIAGWRSDALADLLRRIRTAAATFNVALEMDVRASWDDPGGDRALSGHDYGILLESVDRIAVWNYFALNDRAPEYAGNVTSALRQQFDDRFVISTGLWAEGEGAVVSPEDMVNSLSAVAAAGATAYSVTPASLMTRKHWETLADLWST